MTEDDKLRAALLDYIGLGAMRHGTVSRNRFDALAARHGLDADAIILAAENGRSLVELRRQLAIPLLRRLMEKVA